MTAALAVAVGAAIYFIYQEIQKQREQMDAMSRHMRKLEALVWTYNIRPRGPRGGAEFSDVVTDTEDEDSSVQEEGEGENYVCSSGEEVVNTDVEDNIEDTHPLEHSKYQPPPNQSGPSLQRKAATPPTREFMQQRRAVFRVPPQYRQAHQMMIHQPGQPQRYPAPPQSFAAPQLVQGRVTTTVARFSSLPSPFSGPLRPPAPRVVEVEENQSLPDVISFDSTRVTTPQFEGVIDLISEDESQDQPSGGDESNGEDVEEKTGYYRW